MLGKAMRFATVCTLAFAICGKANRDKGAADSKGTTEDLENRLMQEANFEDHLSNTTNVSSTLLWKPSSKTSLYSSVRRLAVIGALSAAVTADAFTSPGVQPSGVRPFQNDMLRPVNANPANPNLATSQVSSSKSALFSESASSGSPDNDDLASPSFDEIAFEKKNAVRKKYSLKPLTIDEFMQIDAKVEEMSSIQREKASAIKAANELANEMAKPKQKSSLLRNLFGGVLQDTCESNWDCQRPQICCDYIVKKACCFIGGEPRASNVPQMMPIPVLMPPKDDGPQVPRGGPDTDLGGPLR